MRDVCSTTVCCSRPRHTDPIRRAWSVCKLMFKPDCVYNVGKNTAVVATRLSQCAGCLLAPRAHKLLKTGSLPDSNPPAHHYISIQIKTEGRVFLFGQTPLCAVYLIQTILWARWNIESIKIPRFLIIIKTKSLRTGGLQGKEHMGWKTPMCVSWVWLLKCLCRSPNEKGSIFRDGKESWFLLICLVATLCFVF